MGLKWNPLLRHFLSHICFLGAGNSDIASFVINESEVEGEEAKQFLEDVRDSFPQVWNHIYFSWNPWNTSGISLYIYMLILHLTCERPGFECFENKTSNTLRAESSKWVYQKPWEGWTVTRKRGFSSSWRCPGTVPTLLFRFFCPHCFFLFFLVKFCPHCSLYFCLLILQSDLKKLLRNPPLLTLPNANDLITTNPFLRPLWAMLAPASRSFWTWTRQTHEPILLVSRFQFRLFLSESTRGDSVSWAGQELVLYFLLLFFASFRIRVHAYSFTCREDTFSRGNCKIVIE